MAKTVDYNIRYKSKGADKAKRDARGIDGAMEGLSASLGNVARGFAGFLGAGAILRGLKSATDAAIDQERIFKRLATAVEITGESYESAEGSLNNMFAALQRTTEFGDTDSAAALTTLVQLTGDLDKATSALPIVLDLASSGLFDINTASRNVAMAMEGNIEILGRYIPELKSTNNEALKNATASEKAAIAMDVLNEKFGASAQENVKTFAGQITRLSNSFGDFAESLGDLIITASEDTGGVETLTMLFDELALALGNANKKAKESDFFQTLASGLKKTVSILSPAIGLAVDAFDDLSEILERRVFERGVSAFFESLQKGSEIAQQVAVPALRNVDAAFRSILDIGKIDSADQGFEERANFFRITRQLADELTNSLTMLDPKVSDALDIPPETFNEWRLIREMTTGLTKSVEVGFITALQGAEDALGAMGEAFRRVLDQMAAELASKAIIWAFLTAFFPGSRAAFTGASGFGDFFFGGITSPSGGQRTINTTFNISTTDPASFEQFLRQGGARTIANSISELV